jgi:hypothetical protein
VGILKLKPTRIYRRGIRAYFGGHSDDFIIHWSGLATFRATHGKLHTEAFTTDPDLLRLFADSEARAAVDFQEGGFVLHASAVCVNGEAVIFAGTPGAGKSTTTAAFVQAGYAPLADDIVTVIFDNGKPFVKPTEPQIKIWQATADGLGFAAETLKPCIEGHDKYYHTFTGKYPAKPVPLRAVYLLHRSNRFVAQESLKAIQTPIELIKHFPLPHQLLVGQVLQKHFADCLKIAQSVPIIRLRRPKGFAKLRDFVRSFAV